LLLLLSCSSQPKDHWECSQPLPKEFKIVKSQTGDKYVILSSWSRERVDEYNEKQARYKYYYYYLAENSNGWIVEVAAGMEKQFNDSCSAKDFFRLFKKQQKILQLKDNQ